MKPKSAELKRKIAATPEPDESRDLHLGERVRRRRNQNPWAEFPPRVRRQLQRWVEEYIPDEGRLKEEILRELEAKDFSRVETMGVFIKERSKWVRRTLEKMIREKIVLNHRGNIGFRNKEILRYLKTGDKAEPMRPHDALRLFHYLKYPRNAEPEDIRTPFIDQVLRRKTLSHLRVLPRGGEELMYKTLSGKYKLILFLPALTEDFKIPDEEIIQTVSEELQDQLIGLGIQEGYFKIVGKKRLTNKKLKEKMGLAQVERSLGVRVNPRDFGRFGVSADPGYVPSLCVYTPSVNSFCELEKTLYPRVKLMKDVAEDNEVIFSPLPIFRDNEISYPQYVFDQKVFDVKEAKRVQYVPMWFSEYRAASFSLLQAIRNSVNPNKPGQSQDYSRFCYFFSFMKKPNPYAIGAYCDLENEHNEWSLSQPDISVYKLWRPQAEPGAIINWRISFPCSVDEILAATALEFSLNSLTGDLTRKFSRKYGVKIVRGDTIGWWDKNNDANFHGADSLVQNYLRHSFILDKDPVLAFPNHWKLSRIAPFTLRYLSDRAENKGYFEVVNEMIKDRLLTSVPISKYWPTFMGKIDKYLDGARVPGKYRSIIENDFVSKNGTNTLRELGQSMSYEELIQESWENLYSGKRWIS